MKFTKYFFWIFLGIALIAFIFFTSIVSLITDWWWYQEIGLTEVFVKSLRAKFAVGITAGITTAVFLISNILIATHSKTPWTVDIPSEAIGSKQSLSLSGRFVQKLGILVSLVIALFAGLLASSGWHDVLKFLSAVSFGQADPLFGMDVSFYVFSLPVYSLVLGLVKTITLITLVGCGALYILRGSLTLSDILGKFDLSKLAGKPDVVVINQAADPKARLHMGILLALFLVTIAVGTYLSLFNLLTSQSGSVYGAAFTDAHVMVPILYLSVFVYGLAAVSALFYGVSGKISPFMGTIAATVLVGFASWIIPSLFQKVVVSPNELVKETPYIKHNIEATNKAYGLDKVEEQEIFTDKPLTASDIEANNLTVKNVRLWDREPLLSTFSQIQEIRTYYEFASVDNDRYTINNELRQVMLSPRELASDSLPNKNWINERLTFTHGYGVVAGPVNQVTPEGLPVLFIKDLPPKSQVKELEITRPEVYYGEIPNEYVIVKTKSKDFDYPKGEENVYATYAGKGGVEINSPFKRLLFAMRFGSLRLLLSGDITSESRILYYRNIKERVAKVAPFLTYDRDPYLVIAEGKMYWILDAYTSTDRYPYSQQLQLHGTNVNYVRNSVKVVVDTYDGAVKFYQSDLDDPIIKTYAKIYPQTFLKLDEMPKSLISHLRYPEDIFALQTEIYTTYHMDDPQIFYNKEDQWEIPAIAQGSNVSLDGETPIMDPRHMIMKLPGEEKEEFILMLPFTPRAKDNLSAWMVARNDGEQYGKLVAYRFPKDTLVFGPKQIIGRISQDAQISQQISLWDQGGSQVIQGSLLVIPIESSLVYVRPLYLKAATGKIPELKRVIVAYENKVVMADTLESGLAKIFGSSESQAKPSGEISPKTAPSAKATDNLLQQASGVYDAAIKAQREGDWGKYGEEIKKLGEILNDLQE